MSRSHTRSHNSVRLKTRPGSRISSRNKVRSRGKARCGGSRDRVLRRSHSGPNRQLELDRRFLGKTATERRHPGYQFSHCKRFRQVIIGPEGKAVHRSPTSARAVRISTRESMACPQTARHLKAIDPWQHHIENDQLVIFLLKFANSSFAIMD